MKTRRMILTTTAFVATLAAGSALAHPGGMGGPVSPAAVAT